MRKEKAKDTPRLQDTYKELNQIFKRCQAIELKSPFERVSPGLFNRIASLFDAPSLARATAVSRIWRKSILEGEEIFRNFEMEGKEAQLSRGLAINAKRCRNTMRTVKFNVRADFGGFGQREHFRSALLASFITFKSLEVSYHRGLHPMIISFVGECHSLLHLIVSNRNRGFNLPGKRTELPPTWKANFRTFTWGFKLDIFNPNESLVDRLREAKEVAIWSSGIMIVWAVKLMSLSPNLITLELLSIQFEATTSIPPPGTPGTEESHSRSEPRFERLPHPKSSLQTAQASKPSTSPLHRLCHPKPLLSRSSIQFDEARIGFDFSSG